MYKDWIKNFEISVLLYSQQEIQSGKIKNNTYVCAILNFPPLNFLVLPNISLRILKLFLSFCNLRFTPSYLFYVVVLILKVFYCQIVNHQLSQKKITKCEVTCMKIFAICRASIPCNNYNVIVNQII